MLSADSISLKEFRSVLNRYQTHIDTLSESKHKSSPAVTLKELDVHRLSTIPDRLAKLRDVEGGQVSLTKYEVEQLISWKLCVYFAPFCVQLASCAIHDLKLMPSA